MSMKGVWAAEKPCPKCKGTKLRNCIAHPNGGKDS